MKKILANKTVVLVFIITAVIVLLSSIARLLTPNNPIVLEEFMVEKSSNFVSNFATFQFGDPLVQIPTSFTVYNISLNNQLVLYLNQLQEYYELVPHEQVENLYIGPEYSATLTPQSNVISLSLTNPLDDYTPPPLNLETIVQDTSEVMKNTFPSLNLTAVESAIQYYDWDLDLYNESSQLEAKVVRIPFALTVVGYPVLLDKNHAYPAVVTATSNLITKIEVTPIAINIINSFQRNAISANVAEENIKNGEYLVISYGDFTEIEVDLLSLQSVALSLSAIQYRFVPESQQLIPFYVFTGTASGNVQKNVPITIITPAI
jgi:hypothetical protein